MRRLLSAVLLVGALTAPRVIADRIARHPDRYPKERLRIEPVGETVVVDRPDGTSIRCVVAGSGPVVMLAHGFGVSLVEWNVVADLLVHAGYRVITFDQRGHERSTVGADGIGTIPMAGDYLAVLEHFDARDVVLVGHSMGGFLAIAAVLEIPGVGERLRGLVLFATFAGRVKERAPQNWLEIPLLEHGILQRIAATRTGGLLFGASLSGVAPSPAEIEVFLETFLRQAHRPLLPILQAFDDEDRYPMLARITVPTVVVCGRRDRTTPHWHSERLAAGIPGARLRWVEGAGHLLNWEAPEALVAAVTELAPVRA